MLYALEPEAVALVSSRGHESPESKRVLRWTVLLSDLAVFFPASLAAAAALFPGQTPSALQCLVHLILGPALVLIDHGHFQYNCINLGLAVLAATLTTRGHVLWGAAAFVAALNHKQMILYFAPAFFSYMLGMCLQRGSLGQKASLFVRLGMVVVGTFLAIWAPFLVTPGGGVAVLRRIFPTSRGLFEDYVANVWCVTSLVVKWRQRFTHSQLMALTTGCTAAAFSLSMACQVARPSRRGFLLALANSSLAFFLFSYQVHEKSVLLPLAALSLLGGPVAELAQYVAVFSMLPLLRKDGLAGAALGATCAYTAVLRSLPRPSPPSVGWRGARAVFLSGAAAITLGFWAVPPPPQYPFLEDAACMAWCCAALLLIFAHTNLLQLREFAAARGGTGTRQRKAL